MGDLSFPSSVHGQFFVPWKEKISGIQSFFCPKMFNNNRIKFHFPAYVQGKSFSSVLGHSVKILNTVSKLAELKGMYLWTLIM